MDTDIRDEIDRSFGDGPAHPPLERQLEAGHRALRRRRTAAAAAAAAVVVIAGGSYAVATSGPSKQAGGELAVQPTETSSPSATSSESPSEPPWRHGDLVRYVDGELEVRPGATVHEHLENPYGYRAPDLSDALDLTFDGHRTWLIAEQSGDGLSYVASTPSDGWASFADWVADQVGGAVPGDDGWPETVQLDDRGEVVAAPGAEILQRSDDPRLGASFAPAGAPTGAAVVVVAGEERSYFVVWRVIDGELDVITTPPRDVVGATFDELLSYARGQYANGEGLR